MCFCNPWGYIMTGILTIIQCIIHWSVCIWIILVYTCQNTMLGKSYLLTLWYFTYFYRSQCTNATTASFVRTLTTVIDNDIEDLYDFSNSAPSASMAYYVAVIYSVLDIVWILAAIVLIVGVLKRPFGYTIKTIQLPWMMCCIMICLLDIIAVVIFGSHIRQTDSFHEWIVFVGGTPNIDNPDVFNEIIVTDLKGRDLVIPSTIMTIIFSRLIIVWFVNVAMFIIFVVLSYMHCTVHDLMASLHDHDDNDNY